MPYGPFQHGWPYSNFHDLNLDWVISLVQQWAAEWKETQREWKNQQEAFENLKSYVSTYFENLDVQAEINKKLDEMAQDGTLEKIINQEIFASIEPLVAIKNFKTDSNTWEDAIEAAAQSIVAPNYQTLIMPCGTFELSRTVNLTNSAPYKYDFSAATFTIGVNLRNSVVFNINCNSIIAGIRIRDSKENGNTGIYYKAYNSYVENCDMFGLGTAFHSKGSVAFSVKKLYAYGCGAGIAMEPVSLSPFAINTCATFDKCIFYGCDNALLSVNASGSLPAAALTNFNECVFEKNVDTNANARNLSINTTFYKCWFEANTNKTSAGYTLFIDCNIQSSDAGLGYSTPGYNKNVIIRSSDITAGAFNLISYSGEETAPLSTVSWAVDDYYLHITGNGHLIPVMQYPEKGVNFPALFYVNINTKSDGSFTIISNISDKIDVTRESAGVYTITAKNNECRLSPFGAIAGNTAASPKALDVKVEPFFNDPGTYRDYMSVNILKVYVTDSNTPTDGKVWIGGFCGILTE